MINSISNEKYPNIRIFNQNFLNKLANDETRVLKKNKAIFLDRDGVINVEIHYLHEPEKFRFIEGTVKALKLLKKKGFLLIVVTNQGAISKGYYTHQDVKKTHDYMIDELKKRDVYLDAIFYCPHKNEDKCACRKPNPGMLIKAIKDFNIESSQSWMIGDKWTDIAAGLRAGIKTILTKTGYGEKEFNLILKEKKDVLNKNEENLDIRKLISILEKNKVNINLNTIQDERLNNFIDNREKIIPIIDKMIYLADDLLSASEFV